MSIRDVRTWAATNPTTAIVLMVVVVAAILYSVLVARALLALVGLLAPVAFLYLLWRFVVAVERIADAAELLAAEE